MTTTDTETQDELDFDPVIDPTNELEAAALRFHKKNPHIWRELVRICLRVRRAGRRFWSMDAAFHVVRYNAAITTDHRLYKLNCHHTAYYARWIMRDVPELAGFFRTRAEGRIQEDPDD